MIKNRFFGFGFGFGFGYEYEYGNILL